MAAVNMNIEEHRISVHTVARVLSEGVALSGSAVWGFGCILE
jgi:hypothetical protein